MSDDTRAKQGGDQRIYFRIPVRLPAGIYVSGRPYRKVDIEDLSIGGLAFSVREDVALPDLLDMRLRLPGYIIPMRIRLEVRYKRDIGGKKRIGCLFANLEEKDEKRIADFIVRFAEFTLPCRVLSMASFLIFIDALLRRLAYMINTHYSSMYPAGTPPVSQKYGMILAVYVIAAFTACVYIDDIRKKRFLIGFSCALGAFIFLVLKNITYAQSQLWQIDHLFVHIFLRSQIALTAYAAFAILLYAFFIRKINFIAGSIESYKTARVRSQSKKLDSGPAK